MEVLEVDIYGAFSGRPRNGLHVDHMPSQAAVRRYLRYHMANLTTEQVDRLMGGVASIAIPATTHQKYSEAYGGRNTHDKQFLDAGDLRAAVDSNFNAIKPNLLESGFSEETLEEKLSTMHKINEKQGGTK